MIEVKLGDNLNRTTRPYSEDTTVKTILEENDFDYRNTTIFLDGSPLTEEDMDMSLAELEVEDVCYILSVTKLANAVGRYATL